MDKYDKKAAFAARVATALPILHRTAPGDFLLRTHWHHIVNR